jgi:hypothetical protein
MSQLSRLDVPPSADPAQRLNEMAVREGWQIVSDSTLTFEHPSLVAMGVLWRARSRGRLPARRDFSMRDLVSYLPDMLVLEIVRDVTGRRYRHSFVGTRLVARMGELTGKFLDEYLPPPIYARTAIYYDTVVDTRRALRVVTNFDHRPVSHKSCECICMPLADDGTTPDKLLIVAYFDMRKPDLRPSAD